MAAQMLTWAFKIAQASPIGKIVLLSLANNADIQGRVRFSESLLAQDCRLSIAEIKSGIFELVDKKLIMLKPSPTSINELDTWQEALLLSQRNMDEVSNVKN